MELRLLVRLSFQRLVGLRHSSQIAARTTFCSLRERLIVAGDTETHFDAANRELGKHDYIAPGGQVIDVSIFPLAEQHDHYIRHLEVGSGWPVPTWNLPTERQSLRAASELPAKLSASIRVGATLVAMMGDQSQSKRVVMDSNLCTSRWSRSQGIHGARQLTLRPGSRLAIRGGVAQGGVTDPGELVGQGAGGLVVVAQSLDRERPGA